MKRSKKRGRRGTDVLVTGDALVIGGVTPGSTRRPPGSSRTSAGRLGRALGAGKKKLAPRAWPKASATKALERWENEGGRTPKPAAATTGAQKRLGKKAKSAPKKSARSKALTASRTRQRKAKARVKGSQIKRD